MGSETSLEEPMFQVDTVEKKDMRYGGMIHVWNDLNTFYCRKDIFIRTDQQLQEMTTEINKRARLVHKNFSTVKNYKTIDKGDLCSSSHTLSITFEYFDNDLSKEIAKRAPRGNYFREQKILQIIYQTSDCLWYLQQNGTLHGDIKPANIFFDQDDQVKLIDCYFTNLGRANFQLVLSSPTCQSYLSPNQLEKLRKGNYQFKDNKFKNQVFSLGMTIIEAMLLKNSFDCYQFNLLKVIDSNVMIKFAEMRQKYSAETVRFVQQMVEVDQSLRPSFGDILSHPLMKTFKGKISIAGGRAGSVSFPTSPPSQNVSFNDPK